jgi:hypothetical protein
MGQPVGRETGLPGGLGSNIQDNGSPMMERRRRGHWMSDLPAGVLRAGSYCFRPREPELRGVASSAGSASLVPSAKSAWMAPRRAAAS